MDLLSIVPSHKISDAEFAWTHEQIPRVSTEQYRIGPFDQFTFIIPILPKFEPAVRKRSLREHKRTRHE
jgi:hypothetical protein